MHSLTGEEKQECFCGRFRQILKAQPTFKKATFRCSFSQFFLKIENALLKQKRLPKLKENFESMGRTSNVTYLWNVRWKTKKENGKNGFTIKMLLQFCFQP